MQTSLLSQQRTASLASTTARQGLVPHKFSRSTLPTRPDVQVSAKGKKGGGRPMMPGQQMQMYMEGKLEVKEGRWLPLSVVKGGPAANYLLKAMESEWGRKLYSKTLLRQIGMAIYRDREKIEQNIRERYPPFAKLKSKNFQYAFKIRDKSNPQSWIKADKITVFPPEEVMGGTAQEQLSRLINPESIAQMFSKS
ncbi:hypothetical protein DUNSADRAFT_12792 [Dunaliella salina]|uniref:Uncharacterized protein n=1 Tax=Dunaliella salina TaxID=3046 RepID=A0ABQ7GAJ2_DUNSA|nr:hypothetical protein DUNSADRAFT_12792 [Dunaliella salina]|eukprot:KAF5831632.1 hypothetical protein DUNSADRAFT_12792 [Dunaliella salina]